MIEFQINVEQSEGIGDLRHLFHTDWIDDVFRFNSAFVEINNRFPKSNGFTVTAIKRSKATYPVTTAEATWTGTSTE